MQIAYHIGAHGTDEDRLVRALLKNRGALAAAGVAVPSPRHYRQLLPRVAKSLQGAAAGADTQQVIIDAVSDGHTADRMVFSGENLLSVPAFAIGKAGLYPMAAQRIAALANLFPDGEPEFFLALSNPATLIPALIDQTGGSDYAAIMSGADPRSLRWSAMIRRILRAQPGIELTLWCNEDTPLIWPEVLRAVAGVEGGFSLDGDFDLVSHIISEDGMERLRAFLESHPPRDALQRRKVTTAFLEKYATEEALDMEITLPGWSDALVEEMTAAYEADCREIARMPGVVFIRP